MMYEMIDSKLKTLIKLCRETENYKTLGVVSFVLISNIVDEIGIKLGFRPRDKNSNETIFRYIRLINSILNDNFKMTLFDEQFIQKIQNIELLFIKTKGNIPFEYISEIYKIYYEFRKLDIPNLHKKMDIEQMSQLKDIKAYSLFSPSQVPGKMKQDMNNKIKNLVLHDIKNQQQDIQKKLEKSYDRELFEKAIYLKNAKSAIKSQESGKIVIKGRLKDNIAYQSSLSDIVGYFLIGLCVVFFLLGLVVVMETIFYPKLTYSMSLLFLLFFGSSLLYYIIYKSQFKKENDNP